jgi:hypothetical protein
LDIHIETRSLSILWITKSTQNVSNYPNAVPDSCNYRNVSIGIGNDFLNRIPVVEGILARTDKWDCIKLKDFYTTKEIIIKVKRQPSEREKVFASYSSNGD